MMAFGKLLKIMSRKKRGQLLEYCAIVAMARISLVLFVFSQIHHNTGSSLSLYLSVFI